MEHAFKLKKKTNYLEQWHNLESLSNLLYNLEDTWYYVYELTEKIKN